MSFVLEELTAARSHLEQSVALYNLREYRSVASGHIHDLGMSSQSFAALALWQLGYLDQAFKSSQAAVSLARKLAHLLSETVVIVAERNRFHLTSPLAPAHTRFLVLLKKESP